MLSKLQLSIKILREATDAFIKNLIKIKKTQDQVRVNQNEIEKARKIEEVRNKLGI